MPKPLLPTKRSRKKKPVPINCGEGVGLVGKKQVSAILRQLGGFDEPWVDISVDSSSPVPQGETDQHSSISCGRKEKEANAGTRVWCKE